MRARGGGGAHIRFDIETPAVADLMIGHGDDQTTLSIGCLAEQDAGAGTLTFLEPGVE